MTLPAARIRNALPRATGWYIGIVTTLGVSLFSVPAASEMPAVRNRATAALPHAVIARARQVLEGPGVVQPQPIEWLKSRGRECNLGGNYKNFCQGPRRAPQPHGTAAALAERLGLGTDQTVRELMRGRPRAAWVAAAGGPTRSQPMLWPVATGRFWRGFGNTRHSKSVRKRHQGVDIGAPDGTPIRAANDGIVAYSDNGIRGFGNLLVLVHPDESVTFYAHCRAAYLFPGQRARRGQTIAEVGHTGIARGPHLHFEWRDRGQVRDPVPRFEDPPARARADQRRRAVERRQNAKQRKASQTRAR